MKMLTVKTTKCGIIISSTLPQNTIVKIVGHFKMMMYVKLKTSVAEKCH